ncbi:site-specific DNA-methyltransferase [Orbaceae bacterium ac157xtp]
MNKLKMHSLNKVNENIKKIGEQFPNCITERKNENGEVEYAIDFDMLKQELSSVIVDGSEERYQFTWPDKKKSILLANSPIAKTLRPCREESVDFDHTENLYIEGDNLEVLKLLQETYLGKVKMIYIDPPYNTGNDFVYEDDFAQSTSEYLENSGQFDDAGNRLVKNMETNGRFHTDWLNMIYPRLRLAKDLLRDDGVIFISIDDNEQENLKKICDEIFGVSNFIAELVWKSKSGGANDSRFFAIDHEYVLCYSKNALNLKLLLDREAIVTTSYNLQDENGEYSLDRLDKQSLGYIESLDFPICAPNGEIYKVEHKNPNQKVARWRWSKDTVELRYKELVFKDGKIYTKNYKKNGAIARSLLAEDRFGRTRTGKTDLFSLLKLHVFDNPKPQRLIKYLNMITTKQNDIILDFFSGSATTAHAVMQLNAEDGGNRKYIMVQLPEQTDEKSEAYKAGYKNICEIGKERIRRAGAKIKADNQDKEGIENLDIGFRVLKCDSSNMKEVYYRPSEYRTDLFDELTDNIKTDRTPEDLLFQVMLDLGVLLSSKIEESIIAAKKVFNVADGYLIACFDENVNEETITAIAKQKPYYFVMRDSSMANDSVATNFEQIFNTYSPETVRRVL